MLCFHGREIYLFITELNVGPGAFSMLTIRLDVALYYFFKRGYECLLLSMKAFVYLMDGCCKN